MTKDKEHMQMQQELNRSLESALERLQNIWDEIGITPEGRRGRTKVVMEHLGNLLDDMVTEEDNLKKRLMSNVNNYGELLLTLTKELALPPHEPSDGLSILQLEKDLRIRVDTLKKEKHDRMRRLKNLQETDQHLCDIMCSTPYYIPSGSVPTKDQLSQLEEHIKGLETEKERRYNIFKSMKGNIIKILDDLEQCPNTSFERDLVCEEEDSFLLSSDNMKALKSLCDQLEKQQQENFSTASVLRERMEQLWDRLDIPDEYRTDFNTQHTGFKPKTIKAIRDEVSRCEILKLENLKIVIEKTRQEIHQWWEKCYYSEDQRQDFKAYYADDFSEEALTQHDEMVSTLKGYYENNKEMLGKVAKRQELWAEFLEFDKKANDPNRFFNRGCNLLKEEKARKKLMKDLPRVEQEVTEQIQAWEKQHNRLFYVNGERFTDFIKKQWTTYRKFKEQEKEVRAQKKTLAMEEEALYGSRPTTPGKRRFVGTPANKTPTSKVRKINDTARTPHSISRIVRTNHTSVYSPLTMAPRSASKTPKRPVTRGHVSRNVLTDRNTNDNTIFSATTISGNGSSKNVSGESLASVGGYHDFAKTLNQPTRNSSRSSVAPRPARF